LILSFFRFFILLYSTHPTPALPYDHKPLADSGSPPERVLSEEPLHNVSPQRELIRGVGYRSFFKD